MQFYYGKQMPLRVLDEAEYWKYKEGEYVHLLQHVVDDLEPEFDDALRKWEVTITQSHQYVMRNIDSVIQSGNHITPKLQQEIFHLLSFCLQQSLEFIRTCEQIKRRSKAVERSLVAQMVIDHILKDCEHFAGLAETLLQAQEI